MFQPHEYISLDYSRQDAVRFRVRPPMQIEFNPLPIQKNEPLRLELENFFESVVTRRAPRVTGEQGLAALDVALIILAKIEEHSRLVAQAVGTT
jgi:predicted dehydrogenase